MSDQLRDGRRHSFFIVDNEVIETYAAKIGPYAFMVYCYLARQSNNETHAAWPSYNHMAKVLGISRSSVQKAVETLVECGLIEKRRNATRHENGNVEQESNTYILTPRTSRVPCDDTPVPYGGTPLYRETVSINTQVKKTQDKGSNEPLQVSPRDKPSRRKQSKPRKRNPTWDALAAVCGEPGGKTESADFGKTVAELQDIGATPEEIADFPRWWRQAFKGATLTHRCYRAHFGKYRAARDRPPPTPDIDDIKDPFMRALIRQGVAANGRATDDTHPQIGRTYQHLAEAQSLGPGIESDG